MAFFEKELEVKSSSIPGAGNGLFTKVAIEKGARIAEYKGRITTWKEVEHQWNNPYLYVVSPGRVIDASRTKSCIARFANDAKGLTKQKGRTNNAEFQNDGLRVYMMATKNIEAGDEIFVSYGKAYWDQVRYNQKVDAGLI